MWTRHCQCHGKFGMWGTHRDYCIFWKSIRKEQHISRIKYEWWDSRLHPRRGKWIVGSKDTFWLALTHSSQTLLALVWQKTGDSLQFAWKIRYDKGVLVNLRNIVEIWAEIWAILEKYRWFTEEVRLGKEKKVFDSQLEWWRNIGAKVIITPVAKDKNKTLG